MRFRTPQHLTFLLSCIEGKNRNPAITRNGAEVSKVECGHWHLSAFCTGDDCSIGYAKRQVVISIDELSNSFPIVEATIELVGAPFDIPGESGYGYRAKIAFDEMRNSPPGSRPVRRMSRHEVEVRPEQSGDGVAPDRAQQRDGCVEDYQSGFQCSAFHSSSLSAGMRAALRDAKRLGPEWLVHEQFGVLV